MSVRRAAAGVEWRRRVRGHYCNAHAFLYERRLCAHTVNEAELGLIENPPMGRICQNCEQTVNAWTIENERLARRILARITGART